MKSPEEKRQTLLARIGQQIPLLAASLSPVLKFPREPIVHLLDSLYCEGPVFREIGDCGHKFVCRFKQGSGSTLYGEAMELLKLLPGNRISRTFARDGKRVQQVHTWVADLDYQGQRLDFVMCEEIRPPRSPI